MSNFSSSKSGLDLSKILTLSALVEPDASVLKLKETIQRLKYQIIGQQKEILAMRKLQSNVSTESMTDLEESLKDNEKLKIKISELEKRSEELQDELDRKINLEVENFQLQTKLKSVELENYELQLRNNRSKENQVLKENEKFLLIEVNELKTKIENLKHRIEKSSIFEQSSSNIKFEEQEINNENLKSSSTAKSYKTWQTASEKKMCGRVINASARSRLPPMVRKVSPNEVVDKTVSKTHKSMPKNKRKLIPLTPEVMENEISTQNKKIDNSLNKSSKIEVLEINESNAKQDSVKESVPRSLKEITSLVQNLSNPSRKDIPTQENVISENVIVSNKNNENSINSFSDSPLPPAQLSEASAANSVEESASGYICNTDLKITPKCPKFTSIYEIKEKKVVTNFLKNHDKPDQYQNENENYAKFTVENKEKKIGSQFLDKLEAERCVSVDYDRKKDDLIETIKSFTGFLNNSPVSSYFEPIFEDTNE